MKSIYSSYNGSIKTIGYITVEKWHPNNSKLVLILSFTLQDIYIDSTVLSRYWQFTWKWTCSHNFWNVSCTSIWFGLCLNGIVSDIACYIVYMTQCFACLGWSEEHHWWSVTLPEQEQRTPETSQANSEESPWYVSNARIITVSSVSLYICFVDWIHESTITRQSFQWWVKLDFFL